MNTQSKEKHTIEEIKEMLKAGLHFGHRVYRWNPKMKKFIFGKQNNVHIFDLSKTLDKLNEALNFLRKASSEGKIILFVGTKIQSQKIAEKAAKDCSMPYITKRWFSGFLTNFGTFKKRVKRLLDLEEQIKTGEVEKFTKKEISKFTKEKNKLESGLGGVKDLKHLPDVLFVLDSSRDVIAIKEAKRKKIPVVGITDTDADPDLIDYPIPANDDSISSIEYITKKIVDEILKSKSK